MNQAERKSLAKLILNRRNLKKNREAFLKAAGEDEHFIDAFFRVLAEERIKNGGILPALPLRNLKKQLIRLIFNECLDGPWHASYVGMMLLWDELCDPSETTIDYLMLMLVDGEPQASLFYIQKYIDRIEKRFKDEKVINIKAAEALEMAQDAIEAILN